MDRNYNVFEKNKTGLLVLLVLSMIFLIIGAKITIPQVISKSLPKKRGRR